MSNYSAGTLIEIAKSAISVATNYGIPETHTRKYLTKLMVDRHPDKTNGDKEKEREFKELNVARELMGTNRTVFMEAAGWATVTKTRLKSKNIEFTAADLLRHYDNFKLADVELDLEKAHAVWAAAQQQQKKKKKRVVRSYVPILPKKRVNDELEPSGDEIVQKQKLQKVAQVAPAFFIPPVVVTAPVAPAFFIPPVVVTDPVAPAPALFPQIFILPAPKPAPTRLSKKRQAALQRHRANLKFRRETCRDCKKRPKGFYCPRHLGPQQLANKAKNMIFGHLPNGQPCTACMNVGDYCGYHLNQRPAAKMPKVSKTSYNYDYRGANIGNNYSNAHFGTANHTNNHSNYAGAHWGTANNYTGANLGTANHINNNQNYSGAHFGNTINHNGNIYEDDDTGDMYMEDMEQHE